MKARNVLCYRHRLTMHGFHHDVHERRADISCVGGNGLGGLRDALADTGGAEVRATGPAVDRRTQCNRLPDVLVDVLRRQLHEGLAGDDRVGDVVLLLLLRD